jgi:hypothetical protein
MRPTPYEARDPVATISVLLLESAVLSACAFMLSITLSIWGWIPILVGIWRVRGRGDAGWVMYPALALAGGTIAAGVVGWLLIRGTASTFDLDSTPVRGYLYLLLALPVLIEAVVLVTWSRAVRLANDLQWARRARWGCVGTTVVPCLVPVLPFVLWAMGIIPEYNVAIAGALVLGFGALSLGAALLFGFSYRAAWSSGAEPPHGG